MEEETDVCLHNQLSTVTHWSSETSWSCANVTERGGGGGEGRGGFGDTGIEDSILTEALIREERAERRRNRTLLIRV